MSAWDVFWFLFLFVPLAILWVITLVDLLERHDLVGWYKAIWAGIIIFLPWIGVFTYLIARPKDLPMPFERQSAAPTAYTAQGTPTSVPSQVTGDSRGAMS
jgi:hypothetical protein